MKNKISRYAKEKAIALASRAKVKTKSISSILAESRGDQNTSTAGLAILAVVVVGLAVVWAKGYGPELMSLLGDKIKGLFNL
ncbi:hypothetical protein [Caproicibacter fermentans]|uniref:Uncharacterized protein n=1 Tax=Caproicibacter fermentans TaxID=2576756 RepID=A0A7G8TD50_9FIRM|nr:hypothetical protein [Caproicibacter fermentans]QNK41541.1 hypothetical protein HCR03_04565 [Caproicibacter fermentans]